MRVAPGLGKTGIQIVAAATVRAEMPGRGGVLQCGLHRRKRDPATARVTPMGETAKIQRVAVLERYRGTGAGAQLMRDILEDLRPDFTTVKLGSQTHAIGFYEKLGFKKRPNGMEIVVGEYLKN